MTRDKSKPEPAPEGMKWVISKTLMHDYGFRGGEVFQLGLWPAAAVVDQWGNAYDRRGNQSHRVIAYEHFTREGQISNASRSALRKYRQAQIADARAERLIGEVRS